MDNLLRRFFLVIVGLACLASLGCVHVPYCLPEIKRVAAVQVPWPSDDVHVFRVDGTEKSTSWQGIGCGHPYRVNQTDELTRLQPSAHKTIASQWTTGVERGWVTVGIVGRGYESTKHIVAVRFYRPGYETIEVKPGEEQKEFDWKPVADLAGQEAAVHCLIGSTGFPYHNHGYRTYSAGPGNHAPAQREALHFCADEYERIAFFVTDNDPDADATRTRLDEKAKSLRALADGKAAN